MLILKHTCLKNQELLFNNRLKEITIFSINCCQTNFHSTIVRTLFISSSFSNGFIYNLLISEELLVEADPKLYFFIAQGMISIDNVDDQEEMRLTDEAFDILGFTQVLKEKELKLKT